MSPAWLVVAALGGAAFVVLGAVGGHGAIGDAALHRLFDTANAYHAWHALALLGIAVGHRRLTGLARQLANGAAGLFVAGSVLFCGALYLHAFVGSPVLGPVTPVGGAVLILGWLVLAAAGLVVLRGGAGPRDGVDGHG